MNDKETGLGGPRGREGERWNSARCVLGYYEYESKEPASLTDRPNPARRRRELSLRSPF